MARLTFLGAAGTVTGSRFLLETNDRKLLVDCGMFQGTKEIRLRNWEPFQVPASKIDKVFLTHAHIDHTGWLPRLCREGFDGQVHCTHATNDLCNILLRDSAHIHEEDAKWANKQGFSKHKPALPLYTAADAEKALLQFSPMYYGEDYDAGGGLRVKFRDSGHILGSAFVDIKSSSNGRDRKILFSGDIGRPDQPILRDPDQVFNIDYLVLESTYGDRLHGDLSPVDELARVVNESIERGGLLIVPSFSVGRTQTLLYMLRELEEKGAIPELPVYVDSPMSINATKVFKEHPSDFDLTSRTLSLKGTDIFHPRQLAFCKTSRQSIELNALRSRAIIISSSGMVSGGRILHHMVQRLSHPEHTVLFIGYQAEGTRGRSILAGESTVKIHGNQIPVNAKIESISGFSGHGDYNEILAWLLGFNKPPEKTFIVHGEPVASQSLAEKIRAKLNWDVMIPKFGESVEIDL